MMMDRTVLYRGRGIDPQKWFYGFPVIWQDGQTEIICNIKGEGRNENSDKVTIERGTLGEYVGLDKTGNKIFLDDMVKNDGELYVVTWDWHNNGYVLSRIKNLDQYLRGSSLKDSVLVGNIHDNPELLREED